MDAESKFFALSFQSTTNYHTRLTYARRLLLTRYIVCALDASQIAEI